MSLGFLVSWARVSGSGEVWSGSGFRTWVLRFRVAGSECQGRKRVRRVTNVVSAGSLLDNILQCTPSNPALIKKAQSFRRQPM